MPDTSYTSKLRDSILAYTSRIERNPDAKDAPLPVVLELPSISHDKLVPIIDEIPVPPSLLGEFSYAKHALALCIENRCLSKVGPHVLGWIRACVSAGGYSDCERFARECIDSDVMPRRMSQADFLSVHFSRAKALRNMGSFEEAQRAYREVILLAKAQDAVVDLSFGLLLIGKLYGNYLGQRSLFSSLVEAARDKLDTDPDPDPETEERRLRGIAICLDALGQAHRGLEHEVAKVERYFTEAKLANEQIGRSNGVSRAVCHLHHMRFWGARSMQDKQDNLEQFRDGMALLMEDPPDERGLAVRSIQYAAMLHAMGPLHTRTAQDCLESGKHFARLYSLHKTRVQAAKVESEMYLNSDPPRAVEALREGLRIAVKYHLEIKESDINWLLAGLGAAAGTELRPIELLHRNHEIFTSLIGKAQKTLEQFDTPDRLEPEFRFFKDEVSDRDEPKNKFRAKLWLDYKQIVEKLGHNFLLLESLYHSGRP